MRSNLTLLFDPIEVHMYAIGVCFTVLCSSDVTLVCSRNSCSLSNTLPLLRSLPDCADCPGGGCGFWHILAAPSRRPPLG